ncbi:MAG: M3 family oligoendopeptidase [Defluviitaleaceae bacterium]|nr:M3 family oligoendopeptidase [Defluviitaleaceae bacterium]
MDMRWNLDDLYTSFESAEFLADFETAKKKVADATAWAVENFASLDNAGEKLTAFINRSNTSIEGSKVFIYCMLVTSVDESNVTAKKYMDLMRGLQAEMAKPRVMFEAFVGKVDDLAGLVATHPVLKEHEYILNEIKSKNAYLLSEKEEVLYAKMKNTGSSAWNQMKEELAATLQIDVVVEGEQKTLPLTAVRNLAYEASQETRKAAYFAEIDAYKKIERAVAGALNAVKGEALTNAAMRGYDSVLDMTLINSRMDKGTLDALISSVEEYLPKLRKFFKKKAEILGHKGALPWYDLFAPVGKVDMKFTYEEGWKFMLDQFYTFSKELGDFSKNALEQKWTDAEVRPGKRGGAFCMNIHPIGQSRVMMNYGDTLNDIGTLAHEYGHAYHGYCLKDVSWMNSSYTMPIAETASNFCENIIFDAVMKTASDEEKFIILEQLASDVAQVVIDIYSRYLFETRFFEARKKGSLSVNEICELMLGAQKDAYGDGICHDHLHQYMWICKPHYYYVDRNFYNFPYTYGMMFSQGLYAQYLAEGDSFIPKYDKLLAATGSASLEAIGDMAGIDVRTKDFWMKSLESLAGRIDEFCNMAK